jgi:uncharacterized protein (DUF58 family)
MRSAEPGGGDGAPPFGRIHADGSLRLGLRNVYVLPTRFGMLWLGGAAMLQWVGIQTQRNGPLLLSFLMLALMLLALHLTHLNLEGLELRAGTPRPGFADAPLRYPLQLLSRCRREAIHLQLEPGEPLPLQRLEAGTTQVGLPWHCRRRGLQRPGPLLIATRAPLGLFVCWSRWQPATAQLVIPARRSGPVATAGADLAPQAESSQRLGAREGSEHWHDLRPHRPEDGQARLAWKALAQGRGRLSKRFRTAEGEPHLLAPAAGVPHEQALEHLSAAVWQLGQRGERYGLRLAGGAIPPGQGREHRDRCLRALALSRRADEPVS